VTKAQSLDVDVGGDQLSHVTSAYVTDVRVRQIELLKDDVKFFLILFEYFLQRIILV
jgi:hypothetical protein